MIEDAFRDFSGEYTASHGGGYRRLKIEPDGRFTFREVNCFTDYREFGYLKRHGWEIELVPVPQPGKRTHPAMTLRYRTVAWGKCVYLSIADDARWRFFAGKLCSRTGDPFPTRSMRPIFASRLTTKRERDCLEFR